MFARGPRTLWSSFWSPNISGAPSFQDLVEFCARGDTADNDAKCHILEHKLSNAQLSYFCGTHPDCAVAGEAALQRARSNIDQDFITVGLVEEFADSIRVLERVLPVYFAGASTVLSTIGSVRANTHRSLPLCAPTDLVHKDCFVLSTKAEAWLDDLQHFERRLYQWVRKRFLRQARACAM